MQIEFDPEKRLKTLMHRGVDMADAAEVLAGRTYTTKDERFDYGEDRFITFGMLKNRLVFIAWTSRNSVARIISMRKANDREKKNLVQDWVDPDEIPDMSTPYWVAKFATAKMSVGRPRIPEPKLSTTIRLDADIIEKFKAGGPGWQTRINDALRGLIDKR